MPTETDICNIALSRIGHSRMMASFADDATNEGDLMRLHYPIARDSLLRSHPWNFAIKRAELAQTTTVPSFEYTIQYVLPVDCLKVLRTAQEAQDNEDNYRIEGRYLLSNEDAVSIEYIAKVTDTNQFDALFVDILAQKIAAEAAMPLINDARVAQAASGSFESKLREARSIDAQEGTPRQIIQSYDWLNARGG